MSANSQKAEKKSIVNSGDQRRAKKSFDAVRKSSRQEATNGQKSAQSLNRNGKPHLSASSQKPPVDRTSAGSNRLGDPAQSNYENGIQFDGRAKLSSETENKIRTKSGFSGRQVKQGKKQSLDSDCEGRLVKESINSSQFMMSKTSMSIRQNADRIAQSQNQPSDQPESNARQMTASNDY